MAYVPRLLDLPARLERGSHFLFGPRQTGKSPCTYLDYRGAGSLSFWRSTSGFEVDFLLDEHTAIEAKAKEVVTDRDLAGLMAMGEEATLARRLLVCLAARPRRVDGIEILPWQVFLDALWGGAYDSP